jgi:hypothetical protein
MKTRTFVLFLTAVVLTLPVMGGTVVSIQPSSQTQVQNGQIVSIDVDIAGVTDPLSAFQFSVDYNDAFLEPVSVTEGSFLPNVGTTFFDNDFTDATYTPGTINIFDVLEVLGGATGSGTLASLQFQVVTGYGVSPITFDDQVLLDSGQNDITASFVPGVISTPEPATYGVVGSALIGLAWILRKKVRR